MGALWSSTTRYSILPLCGSGSYAAGCADLMITDSSDGDSGVFMRVYYPADKPRTHHRRDATLPKDEKKSTDDYQARLQDLLSEVHKEEQLYGDLMAAKGLQSKEITSICEKIDNKIESARELLKKKQLLSEKKEAVQYVLSAED
ncbi:hypothetical protein KIN20_035137, partial [Parelaphostrongylus tenuis]